jgi:transposase-like protein
VPRYSDERKEAVLRKMLPPHNRPLAALAAEEGISEATLYNWRRDARDKGRLLPRWQHRSRRLERGAERSRA